MEGEITVIMITTADEKCEEVKADEEYVKMKADEEYVEMKADEEYVEMKAGVMDKEPKEINVEEFDFDQNESYGFIIQPRDKGVSPPNVQKLVKLIKFLIILVGLLAFLLLALTAFAVGAYIDSTEVRNELKTVQGDVKSQVQAIGEDVEKKVNGLHRKVEQIHNSTFQNISEILNVLDFVLTDRDSIASNISKLNTDSKVYFEMLATNTTFQLAVEYFNNANSATQLSVLNLTATIVHDIQAFHVFDSCSDIMTLSLPFSSGLYRIGTSGSSSVLKYCALLPCNGTTGGWRKIAYLNSSDLNASQCPTGLEFRSNVHSCRRSTFGAGCSSVNYQIIGGSYSHICGRINALQVGSPDGFQFDNTERTNNNPTVNDNYLDGVSLTYGNPRTHIWSFTANTPDDCSSCGRHLPIFVDASHYSCTANIRCANYEVCPVVLLWNGTQCTGNASFYRQLSSPTTDDIEMRVCRDQDQGDEDFLITFVEIFVQ